MDMLSCIQEIAASSSLSFICQSQNHQQAHAWIVVKNDCFSILINNNSNIARNTLNIPKRIVFDILIRKCELLQILS